MLDQLAPFTCIIVWVPFNENWGQFETSTVTDFVKDKDPTRLVDSASGWVDYGTGDIHSIHKYPGPACPTPEDERAIALSEFGGLGLPVEGHLWDPSKRNWGYRTYKKREELLSHYDQLIEKLYPLVQEGLSAAVYTQITDVEGEVNGLVTYDREVIKIPIEHLKEKASPLFESRGGRK